MHLSLMDARAQDNHPANYHARLVQKTIWSHRRSQTTESAKAPESSSKQEDSSAGERTETRKPKTRAQGRETKNAFLLGLSGSVYSSSSDGRIQGLFSRIVVLFDFQSLVLSTRFMLHSNTPVNGATIPPEKR
jgi:hypothetical protein